MSSTKGIYAFLSTIRILGSACVTVVRTADNRNGQLAVTFFVSFSGSVLDVNTATTALEVAHMYPSKLLSVTTQIL